MRYTNRVTFVTETAGGFNIDTGNHDEAVQIKNTLPCNLSQLGVDRTVKIFGEIDIEIVVARLQRPYSGAYEYVEVNGKRLNVKRHIPHRSGSVFYLEGAL